MVVAVRLTRTIPPPRTEREQRGNAGGEAKREGSRETERTERRKLIFLRFDKKVATTAGTKYFVVLELHRAQRSSGTKHRLPQKKHNMGISRSMHRRESRNMHITVPQRIWYKKLTGKLVQSPLARRSTRGTPPLPMQQTGRASQLPPLDTAPRLASNHRPSAPHE